jgi:hypothetical protein
MSASQEEDCLGLEFDTESDSVSEAEEEESSAGSKTSGKTVCQGGSTGHREQMRKVAAKARRQSVDQKARAMDMEEEQKALAGMAQEAGSAQSACSDTGLDDQMAAGSIMSAMLDTEG